MYRQGVNTVHCREVVHSSVSIIRGSTGAVPVEGL